jgi:glycosyltransferase involved in cell wall biosynthesis
MRPYLLVSGDFTTHGGMDRANHALATYLAERGHEVHLVAHRAADDLTGRPNVFFHRVPKLAGSYFLAEPLLDRVGRKWQKCILARQGRVVVNGGNCLGADVNWVHYVHGAYRGQVHGGWPRRLKQWLTHRVFARQERRALARARLVIANSERTRHDLVERVGVPEERVQVVYLSVDGERFRPVSAAEREATRKGLGWPTDRLVAVFIGALGDRRKGFDTLFAAWAELCRRPEWDADLAAIGSGAELPTWKHRAKEAGIETRVHFLGFRQDVHEILPACDVLVSPTRYEPYGLGVHEALCCGVPAIVSRSAGVAERYPPEFADLLLNDPEDARALAARLRDWRARRASYHLEARNLAEQLRGYTWEHVAERIVRLMESAGYKGEA